MTSKKQHKITVPGGKIYASEYSNGSLIPLIFIHGGPGFPPSNLEQTLSPLFKNRPVIFYDQLDVGRSDKPGLIKNWYIERFVKELNQLIEYFDFKQVALCGHSWGSMILADYLISNHLPNVIAGIFSSPCLSVQHWHSDAKRLIEKLPKSIQNIIKKHEKENTTEHPDYQNAIMEYYKQFACRLDPWPKSIIESMQDANLEQYEYMWGPSEFCPTGVLKDYERVDQLKKINIPSLFLCGRYDEATPESVKIYANQVTQSKMHVFEKSAHLAMYEETENYVKTIENFLNKL
ncbi:proline iminopeptidase-family hydrolase [bacterium]|nr:proline iminopeptidase-family hydrolase [bacterium]